MLTQALEMRSLVVILDGIDEAAVWKVALALVKKEKTVHKMKEYVVHCMHSH